MELTPKFFMKPNSNSHLIPNQLSFYRVKKNWPGTFTNLQR